MMGAKIDNLPFFEEGKFATYDRTPFITTFLLFSNMNVVVIALLAVEYLLHFYSSSGLMMNYRPKQ